MLSKKYLSGFVIVILVFLSMSAPLTLNAADAASTVSIIFTEGTDPTTPLDPDDPSEENTDPTLEPPTNQNGPLSIDYITSFNFGTHSIQSSAQKTYNISAARPYIQISDKRGVTTDSWQLTAKLSKFSDGTNDSLLGAYITMTAGDSISNLNPSAAPVVDTPITLTSDNTPKVIAAPPAGGGKGTWLIRWYKTSPPQITLTVPANTTLVGTHTATITWSLVSGV